MLSCCLWKSLIIFEQGGCIFILHRATGQQAVLCLAPATSHYFCSAPSEDGQNARMPETCVYWHRWPSPAWGLAAGRNHLMSIEPGMVEMSRKCLLNKLTNESTIDSTKTEKGRHPGWGFPPRLAWQEIATCHVYLSPAPRFRLGRKERAVIWKGRPTSVKGTKTSVVDREGVEQGSACFSPEL